MNKLSRAIAAVVAALGLLVVVAAPVSAKKGEGIIDISVDGCTIIVTVASSNGGDFVLEVWDDGELLGTDEFTVPPEGVGEGRFTITAAVEQGNPGLGLQVSFVEGGSFDGVDPYHGADDILEQCSQPTTTTTRPWRPDTTISTTTTTEPETTTTAVTTTSEPSTTTAPAETTTTSAIDADSGQAPVAPPARPLAGAASYTG